MFTLGYVVPAVDQGQRHRRRRRDPAVPAGDGGRIRRRQHITYHTQVVRAEWSTADARWTVTVENTRSGARSTRTCGFLYLCSGYYRYDEGFTPTWPGQDDFTGVVVHPQHWPDGLDVTGKRVVVIGSGATAVTLVPALADHRRARDHAAAVAVVRHVAARSRSDRRAAPQGPARAARGRRGAVEEHPDRHGRLHHGPQVPATDAGDAAQGGHQAPAGRLRRRHTFQAHVRAVGPAPVPGARRRPVRGDQFRPRRRGHRSHRGLHPERPATALRRDARRRRHRHRDGAEPASAGRHRSPRRRRRRCGSRNVSSTRA